MRIPRTSAFTLVELMVVLAVNIVLIALLMPTLQQSREVARRAICASNMKTWNTIQNF